MPLQLHDDGAVLTGLVSIEQTEPLLAWLLAHDGPVDMADCSHVHPAILQLLFCAGARITPLPVAASLRAWLTGEAPILDPEFSTVSKGIPS